LTDASEQNASACRNALFLTDPHVDRESLISAKGTRVAGTCEWITHHTSYRAWLNGDGDGDGNSRLLWISGGPGKGKTMLSVYLTKELEKHAASTQSVELLFFFCSAQDEKRNTAVAVLRGLVHQIVDKRPLLVKHALPYFETPERTQQTLSSLEALWIIFSKLIADVELGTMFCVLDGLDECEESTLRVLLPRFVGLLAGEDPPSSQSMFKLAIVSRDMPGLQGCTRVRLDPDNDEMVVDDIKLFVSARIEELSRITGFNDDFRASVQTVLLDRAEGTFLWVGFAMHELLQKQTCTEIWEALEDLPSGLPPIYGRMLLRIPAKQREISRAILRWVTMAARPLRLDELAAAAGVQSSAPYTTIEQATRDAITHCGPLLKVQEQEVAFVHQSARDYLLRKECDSDAVLEEFRLRDEPSHLELAQKCLHCIAQSGLQVKHIYIDTTLDPHESPLLQYAMLHWPEHAERCSALAAELFGRPALFFQKESRLRAHWWETYGEREMIRLRRKPSPPPLLHMACALNIVPWVEAVLAKKSWRPRYHKRVNKQDVRGKTALHWLARRGNEAVVRLLLDRGADVKAKDKNGETALHSAALWEGNEAIVRLLVERGADVNAKDKNGKTALHSAAFWEGNEAIVRLLVERGTDVNAKDKNGKTVLHSWVSWEGNEAIVRLLVERGADVKAKDNDGETVLHSAAERGDEAIVRLLVERGADVKAKDKNGKTVLHSAASWRGNEAVIRLLMERGADVKAKDKNGKTVLHSAASWKRNEAIVRLLVERGADVKAKDNDGKTVLHSAAEGGNEAKVRLLVERGVDVKAKDNDGKTVLHSAAEGGNEAIVRLLVERGVDVKAKDNDGKTVLHSAAEGGNEAIVRLLVERGVDAKAKDKNGKTVLHSAASWRGNVAVIRLLVERGADVKAKDNDGKTVLHSAASWEGNEAIVRLLVERGADVKAKDKNGKTVLHSAASWEGNEAIVRLLVERGADVKAKDKNGKTVLHSAASWEGNEAIVRLLVERGADAKAKDKYGKTALWQSAL
jgi:ankyrin repeat protein